MDMEHGHSALTPPTDPLGQSRRSLLLVVVAVVASVMAVGAWHSSDPIGAGRTDTTSVTGPDHGGRAASGWLDQRTGP
jgi:hypothetical protein